MYPAYGGGAPGGAPPGPYTPAPGPPGAAGVSYPQQAAFPQYPQAAPQPTAPGQWSPQQAQPAPGASAQPQPSPTSPQGAGPAPEQAQEQQAGAAGAAPLSGLMRMFGRRPADGQQQQAADGRSPSPERRGLLGMFGRSNNSSAAQAGGDAAQGGQRPGVPVVPPAEGLCSRQPPPTDEVARLQSSPLAPSRVGIPSRPPSPPAPGSVPAGAGAAASPGGGAGAAATLLNAFKPTRSTVGMAVDPNFTGPAPLDDKFGPYLRFGGYDPATRLYSASVMMVIHQSRSPYPPQLRYRDTAHRGSERAIKTPLLLFSYAGYNFWRWDMVLQLGPVPAVIEYAIVFSTDHFFTQPARYHFHLPSAAQTWHWGFYSCNGFHDPRDEAAKGGIQPLWRDVMRVHATHPLHAMIGGGDQLYCDDVWKVPSLLQWTGIQDKPSRNLHPFSQAMVNETYDYYFRNYTHHFGKEVFREALASIPQVMVWDDHDIFDGWGSYPPSLQNCPVFAGVYYVARKFYLLFQCHASEDTYRQLNKGWGLTGLSFTRMLGSTTAVVGLDSRGERSRDYVLRPATWAAFQDQVAKLPAGVRHVVVLATVPVIYPTIPCLEEAMDALAGTGIMGNAMSAFLQKTGLSSQIYSQFGEPELLDDLLDHWSASTHLVEKTWFVHLMQELALARGFRFTLLSGDVHCAGVGCFHTMPKMNLKRDHRYMRQVISSAIGNVPPPDAVIKCLSASNKPKMLDSVTREKMSSIFENRTLLKGARNWCLVRERPLLYGAAAAAAAAAGGVSGGAADGALIFQLRCEHPTYGAYAGTGQWSAQLYDIEVPILELPAGTYAAGPLSVAPPMPPALMERFQAELMAAGVGLAAALPPPVAAADAAAQQAAAHPVGQAPPPPPDDKHTQLVHQELQQQQQQQQQMGNGAPPPAPAADLLAPQLGQLSLQSSHSQFAPPQQQQPQAPQDFGLQSDIQEHQQQEQARSVVQGPPLPPPSQPPAAPGPYPDVLAPGAPGAPPPPLQPLQSFQHATAPPPPAPSSTGGAAPLPPAYSYPVQGPGQSYSGGGAGQLPQSYSMAPSYSAGGAPPYQTAGGPPPQPGYGYPPTGVQPPPPPQAPGVYPPPGAPQPPQSGGPPAYPPQAPGPYLPQAGAYPPQAGAYPPQAGGPQPQAPGPYPPQAGAYPPHAPAPHPPAGAAAPGPNPYGGSAGGAPYPPPQAGGPYAPQQQFPAPYPPQQPVPYGGAYGQAPAQPYMGSAPPGPYGGGYGGGYPGY